MDTAAYAASSYYSDRPTAAAAVAAGTALARRCTRRSAVRVVMGMASSPWSTPAPVVMERRRLIRSPSHGNHPHRHRRPPHWLRRRLQ
ncbi:hypothetical protein BDA96_09G134800 [Sorghum bicolor]|uniref:Uncharacterized protein n=1 Tax=Sorghum bicolor TaxID=4558 RepID=A0A921Q9X1_SORBI|nr:hypothetical protein BDA96_09G134800 [Sorghum bicolor]